MTVPRLTFLKLGGSLITDKDQPETALTDQIDDLLAQIAAWRQVNPDRRLLLGHGSGSFGHHTAAKFGTREGVRSPEEYLGYQQVWYSARSLNQIFLSRAQAFSLPLIAFPPSACVSAENRHIRTWNLHPIIRSLEMGLIPLVYGDVVCDVALGGTILSTEDLFVHLAGSLRPERILLAGKVDGVFADFPRNQQLLPRIPADSDFSVFLHGSASEDVTGGMVTKVQTMQALCRSLPGLSVQIFSAAAPGALRNALDGGAIGTIIG